MYSTCLFCQHDLGRNETFATFPVGSRLAYDATRGRLWVVCRHCARWNLTPLEERWEAIEEAERRFRATKLRAGTGEVALARLAEGTELVRIGRPPTLEMAAWRYGDQFGKRRKRNLLVAGGIAVGGALALTGIVSAGLGGLTAWGLVRALHRGVKHGAPWTTIARIRTNDGRVIEMFPGDLSRTRLDADRDGALMLILDRKHESAFTSGARIQIRGEEARRALGQMLPSVNRFGGTAEDVRRALARLEHLGGSGALFSMLAASGSNLTPATRRRRFWEGLSLTEHEDDRYARATGLLALPTSVALALEMASHEESERRALEGDLAALEEAWREAEELAAIADDLLLPDSVRARLQRLKGLLPSRSGDG
jgi:hypothetical protein